MAISVLIVEDDNNIAELLQMYLEKEGYAVTIAPDGPIRNFITDFQILQTQEKIGRASCRERV